MSLVLLFHCFLALPAHCQPPSKQGWTYVEPFSDEFDGTQVDFSKWFTLNPKWKGRLPSRFATENVGVRNGSLIITSTTVPSADSLYQKEGIRFRTGTLKSKRPIKYGYFEVKAKIATSRVSSAFWLYDHSQTTWTEIDVFETCGLPPCSSYYNTNAHARLTSPGALKPQQLSFPEKFRSDGLLTDGEVVAGLEWDPKFIKWYVNGRLIKEITNKYWHDPLFIVLDSEVMADWFGVPSERELPAEFKVDYIRVWQRTE